MRSPAKFEASTHSWMFRLRLFGDDIRAQNNVTLRDDRATLSAGTIDGDARLGHIRVVKTTSDPRFSATRVRPPGVMSIRSGETSTNGRRSTCRGARPLLVKIGQVESESVGWAM